MSSNNKYINTLRVYAEDVDFMGIVYHANYLCYLERSRTEVLRTLNLQLSELQQSKILFAINELTIKYKAPARLDDFLEITSEIEEVKGCSFLVNQVITGNNERIICEAKVKVVCVDEHLKPQKLPKAIIKMN